MHGTHLIEEGTGLQRGHLPCIWPRLLAGMGSTQVPGLTLESRASRAAVVIKIWSMALEEWGPCPCLARMPRAESKGAIYPAQGLLFLTWEAQVGLPCSLWLRKARLGFRGLLC